MGSRISVVTSPAARRSGMSRHCRNGHAVAVSAYPGHFRQRVPAPATMMRLALVLCLFALIALPVALFAQSLGQEVHVAPAPKPVAPANAAMPNGAPDVDSSLKTHTKPIRKDVDLVLVPVTVTDPMNRSEEHTSELQSR